MRKIIPLTLAASALVLSGTPALKNSLQENNLEKRDARIIVEFKSSPENKTKQEVLNYQKNALNYIRNTISSNFEVTNHYTNLLNAVTMEVSASKVNDIRNLNFVSNVSYDRFHLDDGGEPVTYSFNLGSSIPSEDENISAITMNVPQNTNEGEGVLIGILDSGFLLNHFDSDKNETFTHETFTDLGSDVKVKIDGVDELHALVDANEDFHGKYDDTHSTYFNRKVPFYYDYGGSADNENPDYDVYSPVSDHGLHVASLAAGNGTYKGIAPKAQLALFKVFTENVSTGGTGASDSVILQGLEDAVSLGCDILNMSLGTDLDDFDNDSAVVKVLETLEEKGIFCNIAAGNSGKGYYKGSAYEGWTTEMVETGILSTYSNVEETMTIAAAQPNYLFYDSLIYLDDETIDVANQVDDHKLSSLLTENEETFNWVRVPGLGLETDYTDDVDVSGKIAFILRGESTFADKVKIATEKGAIAVGLINNVKGSFGVNWGSYKATVPTFTLTQDYDEKFATSGTLRISGSRMYPNTTVNQMASFTSDGATYDMRIKPNISTPGYQVKGAVCNKDEKYDPSLVDAYDYYSGTSMATPNYAGALAVLFGEHMVLEDGKLHIDEEYMTSVNARTMSTATPFVDDNGVVASPRIQGAGMVNVRASLSSEVYLEQAEGSNRAKIELGNSADVKEGKVKLSFSATNDTNEEKTYTAKIDIYRPTIFNKEEFPDTDFISIKNTLLKSSEQVVNIPAGTSTIDLDAVEISDEDKAYINEHFEYGCALEGYVTLTADDEPDLSIPFLGYFGDVGNANPIEPFNFEKEEGKVYGSDLVNALCHDSLELPNADFSSEIVVGYYKNMLETISLSDWYTNGVAVTGITDDNGNNLQVISSEKNNNSYTLYVPNNSAVANSMVITQFVNRSIKTNYLTIKNKATNKVILTDHMFDTMLGDSDTYCLAKSHVMSDYISSPNSYVSHRAYTLIPFIDSSTNKNYPDAEYELYFNFTTMDGNTFEKKYDFVIDSDGPTINSIKVDGSKFVLGLEESNLAKVLAGSNTKGTINSDGSVSFNTSVARDGKVFITATDKSRNETKAITHLNDENLLTISHKSLTSSYDYTYELNEKDGLKDFTLTYMKSKTSSTSLSNAYVTIKIPEGFDADKIEVYDYNKSGKRTKNNGFVITDGCLYFRTAVGHFIILDSSVTTIDAADQDVPQSKGCGGQIAATSVLLVSTAAIGVILLAIRKRKEY